MRVLKFTFLFLVFALVSFGEDSLPPALEALPEKPPLKGTAFLQAKGDLAGVMIDGVDRFLMRQIEDSLGKRENHWGGGQDSKLANSKELQRILGTARDPLARGEFVYERTPVYSSKSVDVWKVRWQAFSNVCGVGLLLEPRGTKVLADVVAIPDADQLPEEIVFEGENPFALRIARAGFRVLVPLLINREEHPFKMTNREWLHRPAFQLGRTLVGYEVNKVISGIRCFQKSAKDRKFLICGWGEGGRIALYSGAILNGDPQLGGVCVSGYFGSRQKVWSEPADRNVFRLLERFGDAEIASMIDKGLLIEHTDAPSFAFPENSKKNGKPGKLIVPTYEEAHAEFQRIFGGKPRFLKSDKPLSSGTLNEWFKQCGLNAKCANPEKVVAHSPQEQESRDARHHVQMREIEMHNQWALTDSERERTVFFKDLDTTNLNSFKRTQKPYLDYFYEDVIGSFENGENFTHPKPRTRAYQAGPKTVSYEVVLDVFDDVIAYGILTLPKDLDLRGSEKLPVVVCQHGLEGRPQDVVGERKFSIYKAFATRLAEKGFITFAPQNIYIFRDKFRILQFKANALGKTLFSVMIPQHKVITKWLADLPFVDKERIAFYGLSYGGKSAMRIPPLVDRYCLSICSADFNDWIWKNAATDPRSLRYSYASKGEYEIFEFDLGRTFNYAEMASLICPRPFMVERGHFDGVAPDERVAYEYAKVRHLYSAKLGIKEKTEIEWFVGPHAINAQGTFDFLRKHLLPGKN